MGTFLSAFGFGLHGKPIGLDRERPSDIHAALLAHSRNTGHGIRGYEVIDGYVPQDPEINNDIDEGKESPVMESAWPPWVGFDLDGTLAETTDSMEIGSPIEPMLDRLKEHLASGDNVKIFTARAADPEKVPAVRKWLEALGLGELEITNEKDPGMTKLYDDLAVPVERDQGVLEQLEISNYSNKEDADLILESVTFKQKKFTLQDRYIFQGMPISIENKKGSVRRGTDPDGHKWETRMHFDYGYIRRTKGVDDEGIDVYVGPDRKAPHVYIVKQHRIEAVKAWKGQRCPECGEQVQDCACKKFFDEDKVFIGFPNKDAAVKAYLKQYDSPLFLGPVSTMAIEDFRELVTGPREKVKIPLQFVGESAVSESGGDWRESIRNAVSFADIEIVFDKEGLVDRRLNLAEPSVPSVEEIDAEKKAIVGEIKAEIESLRPSRKKMDRERKKALLEDLEWYEDPDDVSQKDLREKAFARAQQKIAARTEMAQAELPDALKDSKT